MKQFAIILMLLLHRSGTAQDSLNVLNYDAFIDQVVQNHPYAYRAYLVKFMGESQVTQARGAFDPKLFGNIDQKYFQDKQYYSQMNGGLKIPTWFGISAETGYVMNDGVYLNPEQRVPNSGLWYAGIRLELGNGLIIDQRRSEFEKAKLYEIGTELERMIMLNSLKRDASIAYWKWKQTYQELNIYQMAFENASQRLEAIKGAAAFGERPAIDIVEASITVQDWSLQLANAKTKFENAELNLEIYLWLDGFTPLEIEGVVPESTTIVTNQAMEIQVDSIVANHPYLQLNDLEIKRNEIDLKLKKEQLKPQLTLKYNAINEPINGNPIANYSGSNYTWGSSFSYPILSRKERGGVQLAKLKLKDQELKNEMYVVELRYKINSSLNNYHLALDQFAISRNLVANKQELYDAEKKLFQLGESSVFMINSRESSWLKSQIELIQIENERNMLRNELFYQLMIEEK